MRALLLLGGLLAALPFGLGEAPDPGAERFEGAGPLVSNASPVGWRMTVATPDGVAVDERVARQVALAVRAGETISPFIAPGPFRVTFDGVLLLDKRERLRFRFEGRGEARLIVDGEEVFTDSGPELGSEESKRLRLEQGERKISVVYAAPVEGDARLRLLWQGRDFQLESIRPDRVSPEPAGELASLRGAHRAARTIFAEARCHRCHDPALALEPAAMPELREDAPSFVGIGSRLAPEFLLGWILDPKGTRPAARMPALFAHRTIQAMDEAGDSSARDVAAWLATQTVDEAKVDLPVGDVTKGGNLFAELGCIACHHRPDADLAKVRAEPDRLPLAQVGAKFRPGALVRFLAEPARHHKATRMPHFGFSTEEAAHLAAWLRATAPAPAEAAGVGGDAARGAELVVSLGCTDCHASMGRPAEQRPASLMTGKADLLAGCLADEERLGTVPAFGFTEVERNAMRSLLGEAAVALARSAPGEAARRMTEDLNCQACHAADGQGATWTRHAGEAADLERPLAEGEELLTQTRPQLTWVGEKLNVSWMQRVFLGDDKTLMRPWLKARMPAFASRAEGLSRGLAAEHGLFPAPADARPLDAEEVKHGQFLISPEGFGCGACHSMGEAEAYARFEFGANNLAATPERLRYPFFRRWMWDPRRVDPANRMPLYADEDGYTQYDEIHDGEADPQFLAMWQALRTLQTR